MAFPIYTKNLLSDSIAPTGIVLNATNSGAYTDHYDALFNQIGSRLDIYKLDAVNPTDSTMNLSGIGGDINGGYTVLSNVVVNGVSGQTPNLFRSVEAMQAFTITVSGVTYGIDYWQDFREDNLTVNSTVRDVLTTDGVIIRTFTNGATHMHGNDIPYMDNTTDVSCTYKAINHDYVPTHLSGYIGYIQPRRLNVSEPETVNFSSVESITYSTSKETELIDVLLKANSDLPEVIIDDEINISLQPSGLVGFALEAAQKELTRVTYRTVYWVRYNGRDYELHDRKPVFINKQLAYWKCEGMLISINNDPTIKVYDSNGVLFRGERDI